MTSQSSNTIRHNLSVSRDAKFASIDKLRVRRAAAVASYDAQISELERQIEADGRQLELLGHQPLISSMIVV